MEGLQIAYFPNAEFSTKGYFEINKEPAQSLTWYASSYPNHLSIKQPFTKQDCFC